MNAVVFDESKIAILAQQLAGGPFVGSNCTMMLFDTLTTLDHTDVLATLTAHELTPSWYSRQIVSGWNTPTLTLDKHARSQATTVTFSNTSGTASPTIRGWALVDTAAGKVIDAALYDVPFVIPAGEDYLTTPFFTYTGEVPALP